MSEPQSPTTNDAPAPKDKGGGNVFTHKLGPLPVWAWMGVVLAVVLAYYFWKQNKSNSTANTTPPDQTVAAGQIPQFVNQTFVSGVPPAQNPNPDKDKEKEPGSVPPTNVPPADTYFIVSNGKQSLQTIAKNAGIPVEQIVQGTSQFGGAQNHGAFTRWYHKSRHGKIGHVPKGIFLFASGFQTGHAPTGWHTFNKDKESVQAASLGNAQSAQSMTTVPMGNVGGGGGSQ